MRQLKSTSKQTFAFLATARTFPRSSTSNNSPLSCFAVRAIASSSDSQDECSSACQCIQAQSEYKHSLTFRIRCHVVIATKPVHQLQIHPIVHNQRASLPLPSYIWVHAAAWECGEVLHFVLLQPDGKKDVQYFVKRNRCTEFHFKCVQVLLC